MFERILELYWSFHRYFLVTSFELFFDFWFVLIVRPDEKWMSQLQWELFIYVLIHHFNYHCVRVHFSCLACCCVLPECQGDEWWWHKTKESESSLAAIMCSNLICYSKIWSMLALTKFFIVIHKISCLFLECKWRSIKLFITEIIYMKFNHQDVPVSAIVIGGTPV